MIENATTMKDSHVSHNYIIRFYLRSMTSDRAANKACLDGASLQDFSGNNGNNTGALSFNLLFYCQKPPPIAEIITDNVNIFISMILALLAMYWETREFCRGGRPVWFSFIS